MDSQGVLSLSSEITIELEDVGPERAKEYLKHNVNNRPVVHRRVQRYARKMTTGHWPFLGDPIHFSIDKVLMNGQHRLWAINMSGTTQKLSVVRGLPPEAQRYIDQGRARTAANQLSIEGIPNASTAAALARISIVWENGDLISRKHDTPAIDDIADYVDVNSEKIQRAVELACRVRNTVKVHSVGALAAAAYQILMIDEEAAKTFFSEFATGANLSEGHPVLTLRNHIMKLQRQRMKRTAPEIVYLIAITWNSWRAGRTGVERIQLPKSGLTDKKIPKLLV